jgi:hypothetical protein
MITTTTQEDPMPATLPTTTTQALEVSGEYLARATQLHLEDCPGANLAINYLALALAQMELAGLTDGTHLINMVAHLLGWEDMPY